MNRTRAFPVKANKENENNNDNLKRGPKQQQKLTYMAHGGPSYNKADQHHPQPQLQSRFNRIKKADSNEFGMPITACPAVTTLIPRVPTTAAAKQKAARKSAPSRINNYLSISGTTGALLRADLQRGRTNNGVCFKRNIVHNDGLLRKEPQFPLAHVEGSGKRKKIKLANAFLLPDKENKSFVYLCKPVKKVKELLTARTLIDSMENLEETVTSTSSTATLCMKRDMINIQNQDQLNHRHHNGGSKSTENSTTDEFELAPLLQMSPTSSSNTELSSARVFMNVRDLLARKQYELKPEDLDTIKDVVKTDMRYRQMEHDDELFRDILRTQLQQIRKQESIVKSVLTSLEVQSDVDNYNILQDEQRNSFGDNSIESLKCEPDQDNLSKTNFLEASASASVSVDASPKNLNSDLSMCITDSDTNNNSNKQQWIDLSPGSAATSFTGCADPNSSCSTQQLYRITNDAKQKLEIDLVYESIPILQREIQMLQALGEKLEQTLKASQDGGGNTTTAISNACSNCVEKQSSNVFYTPFEFPDELLHALDYKRVEAQISLYWSWEPVRAATSVVPMLGVRRCYGSIKEFRIEQKSLTEIKNADDNQWFYIPINDANRTELKRTSFKKLKENPEILLQYLKPRDNVAQFNFLEQDPMFLNNKIFDYKEEGKKVMVSETSSEHFFLDDTHNHLNHMLAKGSTIGDAGNCLDGGSNIISVNALKNLRHNQNMYLSQYDDNQMVVGVESRSFQSMPINVSTIQHLVMQQLIRQQEKQQNKQSGDKVNNTNKNSNKVESEEIKNEKMIPLTKELRPSIPTSIPPSSPPIPPPPPPLPPAASNLVRLSTIQKNQLKCVKRTHSFTVPSLSTPQSPPMILPLKSNTTNTKVLEPKGSYNDRLSGGKHNKDHLNIRQQMEYEKGFNNEVFCTPFTEIVRTHRIRRTVTPLSPGKTPVEPKTHLLRTAIVGLVQISVFLLLIMAFTYPEAHC